MAKHGEKYDHDFLANRLRKVSPRFEKISSDESLWKGVVWIGPRSQLGTIEWVIRECLNGGTTVFHMPGNLLGCDYWYWTEVIPRGLQFIDPHQRFPNMKVALGTAKINNNGSHEVDWFFLEELKRRLLAPPKKRYQDEGNDGWARSHWDPRYGWCCNCCRRHRQGFGRGWSVSRDDCSD